MTVVIASKSRNLKYLAAVVTASKSWNLKNWTIWSLRIKKFSGTYNCHYVQEFKKI